MYRFCQRLNFLLGRQIRIQACLVWVAFCLSYMLNHIDKLARSARKLTTTVVLKAVILESQHGLGKHVSQHQCMGPVLQALKTLAQSRHFTMPGTTHTSRYLDTTPESSPTSQVIRSTSSAPFIRIWCMFHNFCNITFPPI